MGLLVYGSNAVELKNHITIKQIAVDEWPLFKEIWLDGLQTSPFSFASTYQEWIVKDDAAWQKICKENTIFCAFKEGEVIACAGLAPFSIEQMKHKGTFSWLFVRSAYRQKGIAKELLKTVIEYARNNGIIQLICGVTEENTLVKDWYRKYGFIEYGVEPCSVRRQDGTFSSMSWLMLFLDLKS